MPFEVGVNSYISVTDADAYFLDRYGYPLWSSEDDPTKEVLLVSSTQALDNMCTWYHTVHDDDNLAFSSFSETPQEIKDALCEIAYKMLESGSPSTETDDPLESLKAGPVELRFKASTPSSPLKSDLIMSLLGKYGMCGGIGGTKVVNIVRS